MLNHLESTLQVRLKQLLSFLFYGQNLRILFLEFIPDVDLCIFLWRSAKTCLCNSILIRDVNWVSSVLLPPEIEFIAFHGFFIDPLFVYFPAFPHDQLGLSSFNRLHFFAPALLFFAYNGLQMSATILLALFKGLEHHSRLGSLKEIIVFIYLLLVYENICINALRLFECTWLPILRFALQLVGVIELALIFS